MILEPILNVSEQFEFVTMIVVIVRVSMLHLIYPLLGWRAHSGPTLRHLKRKHTAVKHLFLKDSPIVLVCRVIQITVALRRRSVTRIVIICVHSIDICRSIIS